VLIDHPLTGYSPIVALILLSEWVFLALFLRKLSIGMDMLEALVTRVSLSFGIWMQVHLGFFEQTEVVSFAIAEIGAYDPK
jgi:hypothetical protein